MSASDFALLAALSHGAAGVTIVKGEQSARGDNGVFLSVLATVALAARLWLGWRQAGFAILPAPTD